MNPTRPSRRAARRRRSAAPTVDQQSSASFSRRRFLGVAAAGSAALATGFRLSADPAFAADPGAPNLTFHTMLRRREDQLRVRIEFWNLEVDTSDGFGRLLKQNPTKRAHLVYDFGAQHVAEEAFFKAGGNLDASAQDWPTGDDFPPPPPGLTGHQPPPQAGQVNSRLSGSSRLAFEVPDSALPLRYSAETLLDWLPLQPRLVPTALPRDASVGRSGPSPRAPQPDETAIEYPWRLILSPHAGAAWAHDVEPVDHGTGRYELWHTRLAVRGQNDQGSAVIDEDDDDGRTVRAVWATDTDFAYHVNRNTPAESLSAYSPFRMALTPRDRLDIVRLSSDWRLAAAGRETTPDEPFVPEVVEIDKLMLSSFGGWLTSSFTTELLNATGPGTFLNPGVYNSSLLQWNHIAAMGRDSYARVVRKGWLFPFGFKAALVTVTERQFNHEADNLQKPKGAYLRQRIFIVVLKANRAYEPDEFSRAWMEHGGRELPFRRITCLTRITPDLDDPTAVPKYHEDYDHKRLFVPRFGGQPFRFRLRGSDWSQHAHTIDAPVVFVDDEIAYAPEKVAKYVDTYAEDVGLDSARVALAPELEPGDTTFPVQRLTFVGRTPRDGYDANQFAARTQPGFFPALDTGRIALTDAGRAAAADVAPPDVAYYDGYLTNGFGSQKAPGSANRGDVFLEVTGTPPAVAVSTRNAGGLAAPELPVRSVSRILGPTGPATSGIQNLGEGGNIADGEFDPAQVLGDGVKILGGIALVEVINAVGDFVAAPERALKIVSHRAEDPNRVITEIDWHPELKAGPQLGADLVLFAPRGDKRCDLHAEIVTNLDDASASTYRIEGLMTDVVVNLFGGREDGGPADPYTFVRVPFQRLAFRAGTLVNETVEPVLGEVSFHGPLGWVNDLARYMALVPGAPGGSSASLASASAAGDENRNGPYVEVTETGVVAGLGVALPEIGVGIMSLSNVAISAALRLPFDGSAATLRFGFSSREDPFSLTVWGIGGGGFVGLSLSISGVELLEFALEFGACISISIAGLASGKVEIKAGIYFKIETVVDDATGQEVQQCTLEAYVRLHGSVDVLGLIEASITFYLGLSYNFSTSTLAGEGRVTVEIEVLVFSGSVTLKVRKEIRGSSSSSSLASDAKSAAPDAAASARAAVSEPLALEEARPTWSDLITQTDWEQYCTTFATVGA